MKFRSYALLAVRSGGGAAKTIAERISIVNHWLAPRFGTCDLAQIAPRDVAGLVDAIREAGASEARVHSVISCLRFIMGRAKQERLVFDDPTAGFRARMRAPELQALTPAQRDALDAQLHEQSFNAAPAILLRVMLWTGLRVSEALAISPYDYDREAQTLRVRSGKSDAAARIVDVPDRVTDALEHWLGYARNAPHQTTLRRALNAACQAADVPQIRIHDLRHTRITTQLLAGVPVGYVSKQAGHKDPRTTLKTYDHWIQASSREQRRSWANS